KKVFVGDFDVGKALELIYGSYDYKRKDVKWKITREDLDKLPEGSGNDPGPVYTASKFTQSFTQGGVLRFIIITEAVTAHYTCHACAPIIGGAVFSQKDETWQLDTVTKVISRIGEFGMAPKPKLIKVGQDVYAARFDSGYTAAGESSQGMDLIGEVGNELQ